MSSLQTLSRGLTALELVAQKENGLAIAELAEALGVHRAIVYRLVTTLEGHGLVTRGRDGRICLGGGVVALASRVEPQLRAMARPLLQELAERTRATAFLCVGHGDECVAVEVAEPETLLLRVSYRVGSRHPLERGAAGIAVAALRPERPDDSEALRQARRDGYSITRGQLQAGAVGVAAPLVYPVDSHFRFEGCVGVVALQDLDVEAATAATVDCARRLVKRME
ncbi:helix-turn-helix domain-containing protein [Marinobacter sp. 71-i]|uniref:HTH-type transcriptional repressor AllR n=1 Tax=Marinobacter iranensis TaxID=2962607 RepID=A0ABT5Y8P4_9GAMM|nr:helix-turn-helix domain-containing protein [Marinobacter iranensis]MDF0750035.1 helix-turn-helix domain-containing protein [Marinobacter iranensis]